MWTFEQTTGKWYDAAGTHVTTGYAGGNCGKDPIGINNPDMQCVKDVGPLPVGFYTMGELVPESHLGKDAIPLLPAPSNSMCGRGDFYIHGDTETPRCASEGCIVLPHDVRMAAYNSGDKQVQVVRTWEGS
jgi:hypothetical protein